MKLVISWRKRGVAFGPVALSTFCVKWGSNLWDADAVPLTPFVFTPLVVAMLVLEAGEGRQFLRCLL